MKVKDIFQTKLDGPFSFKYKKKDKFERPCYIIVGFISGVFTVFCPAIKIGGINYCNEWNLAKAIDCNENSFVSWGRDNYLN